MASLFTAIPGVLKFGNLGVGVAIFMMLFYIAFWGKPVDAATAKFRSDLLKYGFLYSVITALLALVPTVVTRAGPLSERLAFSPDFDSEKLQPPIIRLPDGTQAQHDAKFILQPSSGTQVVQIAMDATLDQVRNLRQASVKATSAWASATKQRDALAEKAAVAKQTSQGQPKAPALQSLQQNSFSSYAIQRDFFKSLNVGDYAKANQLAGRLQTAVIAAEPTVAVIAKPVGNSTLNRSNVAAASRGGPH